MPARTLILTQKQIKRLLDLKKSIKAVEETFREYGRGKVQMPPKIYLHLDKFSGDFRAMPAYVEKLDKCVLKWVNVHPRNPKSGLPAVMAVNILSNPRNGFPLCIMDATFATSIRTGAAGAVAAKYLARKNSKVVALVGCGVQARTQLKALQEIFSLKEAKVWANDSACVRSFIKEMKTTRLKLTAAKTVKECVRDADIVVTTTPSRRPLVKLKYLKKSAHINAIGADAPGKEELEPAILKKAKLVVDSWEQACHSGEINVSFSKGLISKRDVYANLGEIVAGKKKGRTSPNELTVFDSTGLAIQDVALADLIYRSARKKRVGRCIKLV